MTILQPVLQPVLRPLLADPLAPKMLGIYGPLPAANRYVSSAASNGYAVGVNSGTGTSKSSPWLTLDYAIANATSGDVIQVNDGTYQSATRYTISSKSLTIQAENKWGVTIQAADTQASVIRIITTSANVAMTLTGLVIDGRSNTTDCVQTGSSTATGTVTATINDCKFINPASRLVFNASQKQQNLTINRCIGSGTISGQNAVDIRSHEGGNIAINGLDLTLTMTSTSDKAGIWMNTATGATVFNCAKVTGTIQSSAVSGVLYGVLIDSVSSPLVENCNLTINDTAVAGGCVKVSCVNASFPANGAVIRYNQFSNLGYGGYGIIVGTDSTSVGDNKHNNAAIYGNTIIANTGAATVIHGIMLGWGTGGDVYNNTITGAGIGTIGKEQTGGEFRDNVISSAYSEAIRAKGTNGTIWRRNTINIVTGAAGNCANINIDGSTVSTGVQFIGNVFNIAANPGSIINVETGSDATFSGNTYNITSSLSANAWQYQGTAYQTLTAWKAVEPDAQP